MLVKVCKHGNSLSIRLGAYVTRTARIKCGDWVDVVLLCWRRFKSEPPCRLNFEPGLQASLRGPAVDKCSA